MLLCLDSSLKETFVRKKGGNGIICCLPLVLLMPVLLSPNPCFILQVCSKVQHILEIWTNGQGVISMHCFQNVIPVEAYTREACMVDAIGKASQKGRPTLAV